MAFSNPFWGCGGQRRTIPRKRSGSKCYQSGATFRTGIRWLHVSDSTGWQSGHGQSLHEQTVVSKLIGETASQQFSLWPRQCPPGEGTRPTPSTKPCCCRPGALTRHPFAAHNENCCFPSLLPSCLMDADIAPQQDQPGGSDRGRKGHKQPHRSRVPHPLLVMLIAESEANPTAR